MDKKELDEILGQCLEKRNLGFALDRHNFINGWNDCLSTLQKEYNLNIDQILQALQNYNIKPKKEKK